MGVEQVIKGRPRDLGGFAVRRVLPSPSVQMVGPFIFFDHMGPVSLAAGAGLDVRPHRASRQPGLCAADHAGRRQLDDRGLRDRPLGTLARR